jgi:hypothetical protein
VRNVNGALKQGGRRQWKFELKLASDRDGAVGLYQHAFIGEIEDFARSDLRSLDKPACSFDRETEEASFLIHGSLVMSDYRYMKYMREAAFRPVHFIGGKRPMVRWNVKDMSQLLAFSELRG